MVMRTKWVTGAMTRVYVRPLAPITGTAGTRKTPKRSASADSTLWVQESRADAIRATGGEEHAMLLGQKRRDPTVTTHRRRRTMRPANVIAAVVGICAVV